MSDLDVLAAEYRRCFAERDALGAAQNRQRELAREADRHVHELERAKALASDAFHEATLALLDAAAVPPEESHA